MTPRQIEAILNSIKLPEGVLYKEFGSDFILFEISGKRFKIQIKEDRRK